MVRLENLGLGKTHTPKLVASLLKQLVYVPTAPSSLASKFLLLSPNARGFGAMYKPPFATPHYSVCVLMHGLLY